MTIERKRGRHGGKRRERKGRTEKEEGDGK
jgi:hypothetical protein